MSPNGTKWHEVHCLKVRKNAVPPLLRDGDCTGAATCYQKALVRAHWS